jgi:hypothetical protein
MRRLAAGILVSSVWSAPLLAQDQDRSLDRITLALQRPPLIVRDVAPVETPTPRLGIFTLLPPTSRGEMIRVSIPIGELAMRAFRGVAAATQRRQEAAARHRVQAELQNFTTAR